MLFFKKQIQLNNFLLKNNFLKNKNIYYFAVKMEQVKITNSEETQALLNNNNIAFKQYKHEEAPTVEILTKVVTLDKAPLCKNLVYGDGKGIYFVYAKHDTVLEKTFWKNLNLKANKMRFANITETLQCQQGMVNPFAIVNDSAKKITKFIIDKNLMEHEYWSGHPMTNCETLEFKREDLLQYFEKIGRNTTVFDISEPFKEEKKEEKKVEKKKEQPAEGETLLKITTKKTEDLSDWYSQALLKSEMLEYYDISGCYILRPQSYFIWEQIQGYLNGLIKNEGVDNCYFPMFVTQKALETEKDHIEGFSPEVAWVTKSGSSNLNEPIAIRPTSETIMYPTFKKWINSHRDLPLKINQWSNVVRWEFKHPTPFIRTREFLWQEGHTAHASKKEADEMTYTALEMYRSVYEDFLAIPVIKGVKTEGEKFPGGEFTTTVETIIPENGRAIQAATSHQLGQNFAKMFNVTYDDEKKQRQMIWQTSWGLTTRSIGVMILYHGDNTGMVLPPKVAHTQVVIVPILMKDTEKYQKQVDQAHALQKELKKAGIRAKVDDRDCYNPGWKYAHWEVKGTPIRLELGPKDFDKNEVRAVIRCNNKKFQMKQENIVQQISEQFDEIHKEMFNNAKAKLDGKIRTVKNWGDFMKELNNRNSLFTPWCNVEACEENVKQRSGDESKLETENEEQLTGAAKSLCMPLDQPEIKEDDVCFACGKKATKWVYWGRSY